MGFCSWISLLQKHKKVKALKLEIISTYTPWCTPKNIQTKAVSKPKSIFSMFKRTLRKANWMHCIMTEPVDTQVSPVTVTEGGANPKVALSMHVHNISSNSYGLLQPCKRQRWMGFWVSKTQAGWRQQTH
jgi:hypothetical protein